MTRNDLLGTATNSPAPETVTFPEVTAFLLPYLPVNPLPFLAAMTKGCTLYGADWVKTNDFKAILHLITMMAHGQAYQLDGYDEYWRLETLYSK